MPTLQEHFHFRIKFVDVKLRFTHFCKSMCILVLVTVSVWMGLRWLCRCKRLHWERRLICNPYHHNKPKHTPVNYLKHQMGTEDLAVRGGKNSFIQECYLLFYLLKSMKLMLFILEKQITGFHQQVFECIHVFTSVLSMLFPFSVWAGSRHCTGQRVCVCVCVKQQHWSV